MISYAPLWNTMKKKGLTIDDLRREGHLSSTTIRKLQMNESVYTNVLNTLCELLDCSLPEVVQILLEDKHQHLPES